MALARGLLLLASVSFLVAGCANLLGGGVCGAEAGLPIWTPNAAATQPAAPLRVDLDICDPDGFFTEGSEVVLTLYSSGHEPIFAGVTLSDGVHQVGGSTSYVGALAPGTPHYVRSVLRADEPGRYHLRGWGEVLSWGFNGSRAAPSETLGIERGPHAAEIVPACYHSGWAVCEPPDLQIEVNATQTDPSDVTVRLAASEYVYGRGMFHTYANLRPAWRVVDLVVVPGQPTILQAKTSVPELTPPSDADRGYPVTFYFYPHASIDSSFFKETAVVEPTG